MAGTIANSRGQETMKRRDFLRHLARASASLPLIPLLSSCTEVGGLYDNFEVNFNGKVIIVGAGPAGLAAGYLLERYGIEFEILEASARFGGRVRRAQGFADFPIDLGGEWIHDNPAVLAALIDDATVQDAVDVVPFSPETASVWDGEALDSQNFTMNYYGEYKFKRTTWYGFLERYIAAGIQDRILLERPVIEIDYTGARITLRDSLGNTYEADRVLLAVPLQILRSGSIAFAPALPEDKLAMARSAIIPPGLKVFVEFSERFYPDIVLVGNLLDSDRIFYDAAFRKDSPRHVLALFNVGEDAEEFTALADDDAIIERVISQLDDIFDGRASQHFVQAIVQNWSREPFIQGSYVTDFESSTDDFVATLRAPVDGRLYFAGSSMSIDNMSTVHGAMQTAYEVVEVLLRD